LRSRLSDFAVGAAVALLVLASLPRGPLVPVHLAWMGVVVAGGLLLPWPRSIDLRVALTLTAFAVPALHAAGYLEPRPRANAAEFAHLFACLPAGLIGGVLLRSRLDAAGSVAQQRSDALAAGRVLCGAALAAALFYGCRSNSWFHEWIGILVAIASAWCVPGALTDRAEGAEEPSAESLGSFVAMLGLGYVSGAYWGGALNLIHASIAEAFGRDHARVLALVLLAFGSLVLSRFANVDRRPISACVFGLGVAVVAVFIWATFGAALLRERPWSVIAKALADWTVGAAITLGGLTIVGQRGASIAPSRRLAPLLMGGAAALISAHRRFGSCIVSDFPRIAFFAALGACAVFAVSEWWKSPRWKALLLTQWALAALAIWASAQW
jgi:hypothetical protein